MLIDKPFKANDTISVKLSNGEEIIAYYVSDDANELVVKKASILAANEKGGLGLVPWMMSAMPSKISLNKNCVVAMSHTDDSIASKYVEATSSIQIVK